MSHRNGRTDFSVRPFLQRERLVIHFVVVFSHTGRYSLFIRQQRRKGPLRMPTGQHHDKANKTTSLVSDEVALVIYAALLATWMGCLLWLSLASRLPSVPRLLAWDKLQHFFAYAVLMFFSGNFFRLLFKKAPERLDHRLLPLRGIRTPDGDRTNDPLLLPPCRLEGYRCKLSGCGTDSCHRPALSKK